MLVKVDGGWKIRNHETGKLYPKLYTSKEEGQARIDQMERFKHIKKSLKEEKFVIFEKARPHKYIKRLGAKGAYTYVYGQPGMYEYRKQPGYGRSKEEGRKPQIGDSVHSLIHGAGKVTKLGDTNVNVRYINGHVSHMIRDMKFYSHPTDKSQDYFRVDYVEEPASEKVVETYRFRSKDGMVFESKKEANKHNKELYRRGFPWLFK